MEAAVSAEYTIERGIPIPAGHNSTASFDVLDKMKVGESVLFDHNEWKRARNQCYMRKPKSFTFRRDPNGYRCWRTK
jgi:hypothetical protein